MFPAARVDSGACRSIYGWRRENEIHLVDVRRPADVGRSQRTLRGAHIPCTSPAASGYNLDADPLRSVETGPASGACESIAPPSISPLPVLLEVVNPARQAEGSRNSESKLNEKET